MLLRIAEGRRRRRRGRAGGRRGGDSEGQGRGRGLVRRLTTTMMVVEWLAAGMRLTQGEIHDSRNEGEAAADGTWDDEGHFY